MPAFSTSLAALATALVLIARAAAAPRTPIWRQACQTPIWTVQGLKIAYSSDTFTPGNATFSITSSLTNRTESLRCEVPFNYFGHISGTPENVDLSISLQFNIDTATISLNQTWACANETLNATSPSWVIGYREFVLSCPDPVVDEEICAAPDTLVINSTFTSVPSDMGGYV